ncbi:conjugal transfer protein [Enterococcus sp. BWM-S5]|uniref:Conjugal transfer protein n=1 Tax=Enterococcus larvae TaxID=2794352 RepID=A0ABS4CJ83_9ENTE|nr:conjugal transfer protein [Enterococcus larvae]MBP1046332.1 conjugal transfer protein [Enterococcus larvae]
MTLQLLLASGLLLLFIGYMGTMFIFRKKARGRLVEQKQSTPIETVSEKEPAIKEWDEELYTEKGDRACWYKLTFFFENDSPREYDFYSYNENLTKEFILNDRFYVNDHEMLIVDENGEHYINRKNIDQIDFLQRKLFVTPPAIEESLERMPEKNNRNAKEVDKVREVAPLLVEEKPTSLKEAQGQSTLKLSFSNGKKGKNPSLKKMEVKKFNRLFLIIMISILSAGLIGLIRTVLLDYRIGQLEVDQRLLLRETSAINTSENLEYPYEMNLYMQSFIDIYIPLSNDVSAMDERIAGLNGYFSEGVSLEREVSTVKRVLISSEIADVAYGETVSTVCYKVAYSLEVPVERTIEATGEAAAETYLEYQVKEQTVFLAIDFVQNDGRFSIISYPYFSERQTNQLVANSVRKAEVFDQTVESEKLESIQQFLMIFFEKYADGTKEELSYLMLDVESMGGNYQLKEIESVEAYAYEDFIVVYTKVKFSDTASGITHKEAFSIKLVEENNQFKASELVHNLGGF